MNSARTITQLISDFTDQKDINDKSRKAIENALHQFFKYLVIVGRPASTPNERDIIRFKEFLISKKSIYTANSYLSGVKGFYKWTEANDIYKNITAGIRPVKIPKQYSKLPLKPEEVSQLIRSIDGSTFAGTRDKVIIQLMFENGLRAIEVSRLRISDFQTDRSGRPLLYILGKGQQVKEAVTISDSIDQALKELIETRRLTIGKDETLNPSEPLFRSHWIRDGEAKALSAPEIGNIVNNRLKSAGLKHPKISAHSLRHGAAIAALKATNDIFKVQLFLRHTSPNITKLYLTHSEDEYLKSSKIESVLSNLLEVHNLS
ncbi:MAG: tyrosine-type recombinase/integrase [Bacteroidetes bacterium]|nr:tyrosine-type recombinase/integrase [Bacteroidota bacterium]